MFIAAAVVSSLMALTLVASARGKLVRDPQVMKIMTTVGAPEDSDAKTGVRSRRELVASILRHDYLPQIARGKRLGANGFFASDS